MHVHIYMHNIQGEPFSRLLYKKSLLSMARAGRVDLSVCEYPVMNGKKGSVVTLGCMHSFFIPFIQPQNCLI